MEKTTKDYLSEKLNILKKNIDAVGKETLEKKYATAYKKLLQEINNLSNQYIYENVMYLDLSCVPSDTLPEFANILKKRYEEIKNHLLNAEQEQYFSLVEHIAEEYAKYWCDNVIRTHIVGQYYIFNPLTLEKSMQ